MMYMLCMIECFILFALKITSQLPTGVPDYAPIPYDKHLQHRLHDYHLIK